MEMNGGKGRPTNLSERFEQRSKEERFQEYADNALLQQGIDPAQLGQDWASDSTMKEVLAQIENDFEAMEGITEDIFDSPPSSMDAGDRGVPPTKVNRFTVGRNRSQQKLRGRDSGAYMMKHVLTGDQTGLSLITTAAQVFEGSLCVSDTDQVSQGLAGTAIVRSAAQWMADKEKSDPFLKLKCQMLVKDLDSQSGLKLRFALTDFMNQIVGSQQISSQLFLRVLVSLITRKAHTSVVADQIQEFLEQMFRLSVSEQEKFWQMRSRTTARRADLITGAAYVEAPRFGLQAFTDANAGYHCAHAFVGLVDYLCFDSERETDLMEYKAQYTLLSVEERGALPVQEEPPLLQKINADGSLERSVDWAAREMVARKKLNAAAALLDRQEEAISSDLGVIKCMRLSMRPSFMKVMDKCLLEANLEWRSMQWGRTFNMMKDVDVKLRLMREQKADLRARSIQIAAQAPNVKRNNGQNTRSRLQRNIDQSFATDSPKCSSCGRSGHTASECDKSKLRCRICNVTGHTTQQCSKLSSEKCHNFVKTGSCSYGTQCRFSHAVGVDSTNVTEEPELTVEQIQDMVNAGEMGLPDDQQLSSDPAEEVEESAVDETHVILQEPDCWCWSAIDESSSSDTDEAWVIKDTSDDCVCSLSGCSDEDFDVSLSWRRIYNLVDQLTSLVDWVRQKPICWSAMDEISSSDADETWVLKDMSEEMTDSCEVDGAASELALNVPSVGELCSRCGVSIDEVLTLCAHNLCDGCCPATLCGLSPVLDVEILTCDDTLSPTLEALDLATPSRKMLKRPRESEGSISPLVDALHLHDLPSDHYQWISRIRSKHDPNFDSPMRRAVLQLNSSLILPPGSKRISVRVHNQVHADLNDETYHALVDSDLDDASIDSDDVSTELSDDQLRGVSDSVVCVFDVPSLTDVVTEAMCASLDVFAGSASYSVMIEVHTTAQHELLNMPLEWFCVDGEFEDQRALQQLVEVLSQKYDERLIVDVTIGLANTISALCAEAIYFSDGAVSTADAKKTNISVVVPSIREVRICLQASLQFMMRKSVVLALADAIRSKFKRLSEMEYTSDLGSVTCQWIPDLESSFDLSDKMKARLAVCVANLVENNVDEICQHFR